MYFLQIFFLSLKLIASIRALKSFQPLLFSSLSLPYYVVRIRIGTPEEHRVQQRNSQKDGPWENQTTKARDSKKSVHQEKKKNTQPQQIQQHATSTTTIVKTSQTSQIHRNEQQHSKQRQ